MALEKLLIFGFALAVLLALGNYAKPMGDTRKVEKDGYVSELNTLKAKAP